MIKIINEKFPAILNKLDSYSKNRVVGVLNELGIDIENMNDSLHEVSIDSNRDYRLKNGLLVVCKGDPNSADFNGEYDMAVWCDGDFIAGSQFISRRPWKNIIYDDNYHIYSLLFGFNIHDDNLIAKRNDRKNAKDGTVGRYNKRDKYGREVDPYTGKENIYGLLDKSGYVINTDKYRDMFLALNIDKVYEEQLDKAKDTYNKLIEIISDLRNSVGISDVDMREVVSVISDFRTNFRSLDFMLKENEKYNFIKIKDINNVESVRAARSIRHYIDEISKCVKRAENIIAKFS